MSDDPVIKSWAITVQTVRAEIFHVPPEDMRRIFRYIEALQEERDRLREALRDGRRLLAIARDDRVRLLIQLEQCEKRHE